MYMLKASYAARYFEVSSDVLLLCFLLLKNRFSLDKLFIYLMLQLHSLPRLPDWHFHFGRHFSVVGCLVHLVILFIFISCKGDRVYVLGDEEFGFFPYQYFLRGSADRELLEKPEHFSHPTVDFLALLKDGVLECFHPFEVDLGFELTEPPVRCFRDALRRGNGFDWFNEFFSFIPTFKVVEVEVLNNFLRFIGILVMDFAVGGAVNLTLKMKGDMIIENLDLQPTINAIMRNFLE
ncbi:hypothetical protein Tco_0381400 [Tanacetum coccineum]